LENLIQATKQEIADVVSTLLFSLHYRLKVGNDLRMMRMIERHATDFIHVIFSYFRHCLTGKMVHRGWNTKKAALPDDEGYARRMRIPPWY
jgi:hypothetical protein